MVTNYRVIFFTGTPSNNSKDRKVNLAGLGVSRPIYVYVDSPNLGFPYVNILGEAQCKQHPVQKIPEGLICPILYKFLLFPAVRSMLVTKTFSGRNVFLQGMLPGYVPSPSLCCYPNPNCLIFQGITFSNSYRYFGNTVLETIIFKRFDQP